jgi:hypothetical protein
MLYTCLCDAGKSCKPDDDAEECETKEPIMADDGSGADVTIPSYLMFKQDVDPIIKELKEDNMVRIEMSWALPPSPPRLSCRIRVVDDSQRSRQ